MTLPVAVFVAIVGCVLAVSANVTTSNIHQDLEKERYKRLSAEEQLQKDQGLIVRLRKDLADSQQKLGAIDQVINQGKSATTTLQSQLEAVNNEKAVLMEQVQQLQKAITEIQQPPAAVPPAANPASVKP